MDNRGRRTSSHTLSAMEINGVPLHPLVIHAVVVLVPLVGPRRDRCSWCPSGAGWPGGRPCSSRWGRRRRRTSRRSPATSLKDNRGLDSPLVHTHEEWGERLMVAMWVFAALVVVAFWALPHVTRLAGGKDRPARVRRAGKPLTVLVPLAAIAVLVLVVLTGDAGARAVWQQYGRRRRGRLSSSRRLSRLASSRRNDRTRSACGPGRLVEPALRLVLAVRTAAGAVLGQLVEVRERLDQLVGVDVGQPERTDPRGVHDPAAARQREHPGAGAEVCRPRPVTALTTPTSRNGVGHQRVDEGGLADTAVPEQHAGAVGEPLPDLVEVGAALRDDVRHPERAVALQQRLRGPRGRPWSGRAAGPCRRRTPPRGRGRPGPAGAPGRRAR